MRECEGDGYTGVGDRGSDVAVSSGHESMGRTHGFSIVSIIADDMLEMSVVRWMRGVGGVCEM